VKKKKKQKKKRLTKNKHTQLRFVTY
jgi:hypothetical protein